MLPGGRIVSDEHDLQYVRANFLAVDSVPAGLPAPSYFDAQGQAYVPNDYLDQERDRNCFNARARHCMGELGVLYGEEWLEDAWSAYLDGVYGICLNHATPENVVRKQWLIDGIDALLAASAPNSDRWLQDLHNRIDQLDDLERDFCAFDRAYFGGPVSRDTYITALRERYGAALASSARSAALRSTPQR